MEEQRRILEQLINENADYGTIVKQSQELDKYIVESMRGSEKTIV